MPSNQAAASLLAQVPVCCAPPHTSAATPLQMCPGQAVPYQIPLIPICIRPGFWGAKEPWHGKKEILPQIGSHGVDVTLLRPTLGP